MQILGLARTTLLDYPGRVAASIFLGGCNFRCPYCHNKDIVLKSKSVTPYSTDEIFAFLEKRKQVLSGVCITGGEPTLHEDLPDLIASIKKLGYCVKLDTNGTNPAMLERLIADDLIDYCAMDIKNAPEKYGLTIGLDAPHAAAYDLSAVKTSARLLLAQSKIPYEFRTTVTAELHDGKDFRAIAEWIAGAMAYYLQPYKDSDGVLRKGFHTPAQEMLESYVAICKPLIPNTALRGV